MKWRKNNFKSKIRKREKVNELEKKKFKEYNMKEGWSEWNEGIQRPPMEVNRT